MALSQHIILTSLSPGIYFAISCCPTSLGPKTDKMRVVFVMACSPYTLLYADIETNSVAEDVKMKIQTRLSQLQKVAQALPRDASAHVALNVIVALKKGDTTRIESLLTKEIDSEKTFEDLFPFVMPWNTVHLVVAPYGTRVQLRWIFWRRTAR